MSSMGAMLCWKHVSQRRQWSRGSTTDTTDCCPVWSSFSCNPLEVGISVQKYLNLVADCILFGFFMLQRLCLWCGKFQKAPQSLVGSTKCPFTRCDYKGNKQPVMWSSVEGFFPCLPPPLSTLLFFFFDTDHPTAPP